MTSTETLLPCPFCGDHCADLMIDQGDKWAHYEPGCLEVRTGYNTRLDAPWRDEAIAAWNRRTTPTPALDEQEAVESLAVHLGKLDTNSNNDASMFINDAERIIALLRPYRAAESSERARIVAWLRGMSQGAKMPAPIAAAIERNEHGAGK